MTRFKYILFALILLFGCSTQPVDIIVNRNIVAYLPVAGDMPLWFGEPKSQVWEDGYGSTYFLFWVETYNPTDTVYNGYPTITIFGSDYIVHPGSGFYNRHPLLHKGGFFTTSFENGYPIDTLYSIESDTWLYSFVEADITNLVYYPYYYPLWGIIPFE